MKSIEFNKNCLLNIFSKVIHKGDFTLSSGKKSNFYIDCKSKLLKPEVLNIVAYSIYDIISNLDMNNITTIAGSGNGAYSIICSCVIHNRKNGIFIRKNKKKYGTDKLIEGEFENNEKVAIVDDILTTGNSIKYVYNILRDNKLLPKCVVILVDRQEYNAKETLIKELKIPVVSIMTKKELYDVKY